MATFADPADDAGLVEIGALQVDQHHDHLIALGLGALQLLLQGGGQSPGVGPPLDRPATARALASRLTGFSHDAAAMPAALGPD